MARSLALAALAGPRGLLAASCPDMAPYTAEANPFGWPLAPNFSYDKQECWAAKYPFCSGLSQSPMDLALAEPSGSCATEVAGADGALKGAATYASDSDMARGSPDRPVVKASKYLRTIMTDGLFGKLRLEDTHGKEVEYEATQVHVTPHSLHTVDGKHFDAELMVMHRPKGAKDLLGGAVVLSVLFRLSGDSSSSPIFERMGASTQSETWTVDHFGLADTLNPALLGPSYQYNGSVPAPPCSETATWIVLGSAQPVSSPHLQSLKEAVAKHAGGWHKRHPAGRHQKDAAHGSACRKIVKNGLQVAPRHEQATCSAKPSEQFSSPEGRMLLCGEGMQCRKEPNIQVGSAVTGTKSDITKIMHYKRQEHVTMVPGPWGLDATVPHHGDFGHLLLNGRVFLADKVTVAPISKHAVNGKRYAATLMITHRPFHPYAGMGGSSVGGHAPAPTPPHGGGHAPASTPPHGGGHSPAPTPPHGGGGHSPAPTPPHDGGHSSGHSSGTGHRRLEHHLTSHAEPLVVVSVPLMLGEESPLLRHLGLGQPALARAIRDGNHYEVHQGVDLMQELASVLSSSWYWYTAGEGKPECSASHTSWMLFEKPLEVSLEQLNSLKLGMSGMDSTWISASSPAHLYKDFVPSHAVETRGGAGVCGQPWSYLSSHCWSANFSSCGGHRQSPINIKAADVQQSGSDNFLEKCSWTPVRALDVENSGKGLQVVNNQLGYFAFIDANGDQSYYQVSGLKLHMPSEHMIDDKQFDAELQIVHQKQKAVNELMEDDLAITSFLFQVGAEESPLLKQMHLPGHAVQEGAPTPMAQPLDLLRALGPALESSYYRYDGSVTVPDCSETAKWFVFETVMSMSQAQLDAFKTLFPGAGNNRPVQELHGRTVAKNSFMQGTLKEYGFYLNRHGGRNRSDWNRSETLILVPIIFTIFFTIYIMASLFVREDKARTMASSGGLSGSPLDQPVGRQASPYARF